jgi:hypothetical protein
MSRFRASTLFVPSRQGVLELLGGFASRAALRCRGEVALLSGPGHPVPHVLVGIPGVGAGHHLDGAARIGLDRSHVRNGHVLVELLTPTDRAFLRRDSRSRPAGNVAASPADEPFDGGSGPGPRAAIDPTGGGQDDGNSDHHQKTDELLQRLTEGVEKLTSSEEWVRYLDVQRRFHRRCFDNGLLHSSAAWHACGPCPIF